MPLRILAIALGMLWFAAVARADAASGQSQPPDTADEGYEATVQLALREFGLGNYAEARTLLRDAHGLYANARTLRALCMVEYELKNYPACVAYLEQALSSQERPLSAEHRKGADELRRSAERFIGRYTLNVRPSAANVLLDGEPPHFDSNGKLVLPVGDHELDISAAEYRPVHRVVKVEGGQRTLDIVLVPLTSATNVEQGSAQGSVDKPLYKKWWLWTTLGLVVVAGATTGAVLASRQADPQKPSGGSLNETIHLLQMRQ